MGGERNGRRGRVKSRSGLLDLSISTETLSASERTFCKLQDEGVKGSVRKENKESRGEERGVDRQDVLNGLLQVAQWNVRFLEVFHTVCRELRILVWK